MGPSPSRLLRDHRPARGRRRVTALVRARPTLAARPTLTYRSDFTGETGHESAGSATTKAWRRLHAPRGAWRRWNEPSIRCRGDLTGPAGGGEGVATGAHRRGEHRALPSGDPDGGQAAAPAHRDGALGRRGGW